MSHRGDPPLGKYKHGIETGRKKLLVIQWCGDLLLYFTTWSVAIKIKKPEFPW